MLSAGLAAHLGDAKEGFDETDLAALQGALDAILSTASLKRTKADLRLEAQHTALVTRAFGAALTAHWHEDARLAPLFKKDSRLVRLLRPAIARERNAEAMERVQFATQVLGSYHAEGPQDPVSRYLRMIGSPLNAPMYRALWFSFTHPSLREESKSAVNEGEEIPLILFEREGERLEFESTYLRAYTEELQGPGATKLRAHVTALTEDGPRTLHRFLMLDMATWGSRHVLGSAPGGEIPYLPFAARSTWRPVAKLRLDERDEEGEPVREHIKGLLGNHKIVVVRGECLPAGSASCRRPRRRRGCRAARSRPRRRSGDAAEALVSK